MINLIIWIIAGVFASIVFIAKKQYILLFIYFMCWFSLILTIIAINFNLTNK